MKRQKGSGILPDGRHLLTLTKPPWTCRLRGHIWLPCKGRDCDADIVHEHCNRYGCTAVAVTLPDPLPPPPYGTGSAG